MHRTVPLLCLAALLACGSDSREAAQPPPAAQTDSAAAAPQPATSAPAAAAGDDLVAKGQAVYRQVCIACHAMDPNQDGGLGPAIAGSSLALLQAKVLRNEYPEGYTPKRTTGNMVPLPYLEKDLPALAAYLEQAAP